MTAQGHIAIPQRRTPYQDGNKVDSKALDGWNMACIGCERCHGAEQEGLVGPSLVNFHTTVINGRPGSRPGVRRLSFRFDGDG